MCCMLCIPSVVFSAARACSACASFLLQLCLKPIEGHFALSLYVGVVRALMGFTDSQDQAIAGRALTEGQVSQDTLHTTNCCSGADFDADLEGP